MKNKILTFVFALCLCIPCLAFFTACGDNSNSIVVFTTNMPTSTATTYTAEANTNTATLLKKETQPVVIELIVDKNNKVVVVNAFNDKADTIVASISVDGEQIDNAINKIMESCIKNNDITISGSSVEVTVNADSDNILNNLKEKINTTITSVKNKFGLTLNSTITTLKTDSEQAKEFAMSCLTFVAPEITEDKLQNMSNEDIKKMIAEKAEEYKDLTYNNVATLKTLFSEATATAQKALDTANESIARLEKMAKDDVTKKLLDEAKTVLANAQKDLDTAIESYKAQAQEQIKIMKKNAKTTKEALVEQLKEVQATVLANVQTELDAKVKAQTMTQEQYNAWIALLTPETAQ